MNCRADTDGHATGAVRTSLAGYARIWQGQVAQGDRHQSADRQQLRQPDIVVAILDDAMPNHITLFDLAVDPPALWEEQRRRVL